MNVFNKHKFCACSIYIKKCRDVFSILMGRRLSSICVHSTYSKQLETLTVLHIDFSVYQISSFLPIQGEI